MEGGYGHVMLLLLLPPQGPISSPCSTGARWTGTGCCCRLKLMGKNVILTYSSSSVWL